MQKLSLDINKNRENNVFKLFRHNSDISIAWRNALKSQSTDQSPEILINVAAFCHLLPRHQSHHSHETVDFSPVAANKKIEREKKTNVKLIIFLFYFKNMPFFKGWDYSKLLWNKLEVRWVGMALKENTMTQATDTFSVIITRHGILLTTCWHWRMKTAYVTLRIQGKLG